MRVNSHCDEKERKPMSERTPGTARFPSDHFSDMLLSYVMSLSVSCSSKKTDLDIALSRSGGHETKDRGDSELARIEGCEVSAAAIICRNRIATLTTYLSREI